MTVETKLLVRDQISLADHLIRRALLTVLPGSYPDAHRFLTSAVGTLHEATFLLSDNPQGQLLPALI